MLASKRSDSEYHRPMDANTPNTQREPALRVAPASLFGLTDARFRGMWVITRNAKPVVEYGFFGSAAAAVARIERMGGSYV
jgi:hypothetical protein